jgi:hypothetical protein
LQLAHECNSLRTQLAAAAEELFGAHLSDGQRISTFAWKAEKALRSENNAIISISDKAARKSVNEWKNEVKHMADGTSDTLKIDPAFAAEYHIEHALINFHNLRLQESSAIRKFEERHSRRD